MISIIIPTYNEEEKISELLKCFQNQQAEIIIADGGSTDNTLAVVGHFKKVKIIKTEKSRAKQMNQAAKIAKGHILLFLHADCITEQDAIAKITNSIRNGYDGGCLSQRISSRKWIYRLIEGLGNLRAKLTRIFYGDQAIFVKRDVFISLGGFDDVDIFEDVLFSKKMYKKKVGLIASRVYVSPRRWKKQGIIKTTLINGIVSIGFVIGFSPRVLKKVYQDIR